MVIREMYSTDIESVRAIAIATWRNTYSEFIPEEIQKKVLQAAYSTEEMNTRFETSLNLVVEVNEEIQGYAFFSGNLSDTDVFLESLYIHPQHQGKGLGKLLLQTGLAKFNKPNTLSLTVYKGNPNITFYEREGFKVIKENKGDFFGHPMVFTLMKKKLGL